MIKLVFRAAFAFAIAWMLIPHEPDLGFGRPGFPGTVQGFGGGPVLWALARTALEGTQQAIKCASHVHDCSPPATP